MTKKEYKSFSFEIKNLHEDEEIFTFEGFASTFGNVDLGDDIVEQGAFIDSLKNRPQVPILALHNIRDMLPIGSSIKLEEVSKGLFVKAELPKADTFVSGRVIPQMRIGSLKEMSIGFFIDKFSFDEDTGIRRLQKINLFEISLVTMAMNPLAAVTDFKSFKDAEKDMKSLKDIEGYLKEGGLSNNESKALISKIKEFSKDQREVDDSDNKQCDVANTKLDQILNLHAESNTESKLKQIINNLNIKQNV